MEVGEALGEDILARLRRQPAWWALLLLVDGLLVAWCVLALLPGPRRIAVRGVFVSYRRSDSGPRVGRLHDRLVARLGAERVFLDVESIPAGEDFDRFIADSLSKVDIVLAVIGPQWLELRDHQGLRRLDAEDDLVRRGSAAACSVGTVLGSRTQARGHLGQQQSPACAALPTASVRPAVGSPARP